MKNKLQFIIIALAACSLFVMEKHIDLRGQGDEVVPVINTSRKTISAVELKRIFIGDMTSWPNGGSLRVLINKDKIIYEEFSKNYLGMSMKRVENLWVLKKVRDGIVPPRKVSSIVIKSMVSRSRDFIGFVRRSELDEGVKVATE